MIEIEMPKITCEEESADGRYAKYVVEPLERGFGITLGNCLRRVLSSALPGAAVVGIRIQGVMHEFSTIKGVREDVVEIILNLKNLAVKSFSTNRDFVTTLRINKSTPGPVLASDIEANSEIEILNPDLYICTLDTGAKFEMELTVKRGRGYISSDKNKDPNQPLGFIAIDANFTPMVKANYHVESTRVGQSIDFDKLIFELTTNGTISARELISLAAKIVEEHISMFVTLSDSMEKLGILVNKQEDKQKKVLEMNIEDMDLSVRSYNCLKRASIHTVEDLIRKSEDEMLKVRNLGRKSLDEVINKLTSYGLSLKNKED